MKSYEEIIMSSRLFDAAWYGETYHVPQNPALHYLEHGWKKGLDPSDKFSTKNYLKMNPDVARARTNPLLHYELYGRKEGRMLCVDDAVSHSIGERFRRLTEQCNLEGKGLEIGPSYNPICPKRKGFDVETIDCLDADGLRERYGNDPNSQSLIWQIEDVDYIWNGEDYSELTKKENYYDYILASHLIEHTTDFIGFLQQCAAMLKEDGILSLAVPNKHNCFDFFRENTSLSQVIDKHFGETSRHGRGTLVENRSYYASLGGIVSWTGNTLRTEKKLSFLNTKAFAKQGLEASSAYIDAHEWVFTPGSFRILINDLNELGLIDLEEVSFYNDKENTNEFCVSLKKKKANKENQEFDQEHRMMLQQFKLQDEFEFYSTYFDFVPLESRIQPEIGVKGALVIYTKKHLPKPLWGFAKKVKHFLHW